VDVCAAIDASSEMVRIACRHGVDVSVPTRKLTAFKAALME
jgi:hypothetical protein